MRANIISVILLTFFVKFSTCRDFYLGMFKKNDLLMSQDRLFKERIPYQYRYAKYGRTYSCPITYIRVVDRLNIGRGPRVEVIRGGLQKKYLVLRLTSPYNNPIAVNIFVGCDNKKQLKNTWKIIRPTAKTEAAETTQIVDATETPKSDDAPETTTVPPTETSDTTGGAEKAEAPDKAAEDPNKAEAPEDPNKADAPEDPNKTDAPEGADVTETPEVQNNDAAEE